jgi:hypothetical protein
MHAKLQVREHQFIAGEQSPAHYPLSVHLGAICASQITKKEQPVGFGNSAVQLGNAGAGENHVTQSPLPTDQGQIPGDCDRVGTIQRNELRNHEMNDFQMPRVTAGLGRASGRNFLEGLTVCSGLMPQGTGYG